MGERGVTRRRRSNAPETLRLRNRVRRAIRNARTAHATIWRVVGPHGTRPTEGESGPARAVKKAQQHVIVEIFVAAVDRAFFDNNADHGQRQIEEIVPNLCQRQPRGLGERHCARLMIFRARRDLARQNGI